MKNKVIIIIGVSLVASVLTINIKTVSNSIIGGDVSLATISLMSQAIAEGGYPIGQYCGKDECQIACGVPPLVYTAKGHYWHCKWKDTPGSCDKNLCEKVCDARCFK